MLEAEDSKREENNMGNDRACKEENRKIRAGLKNAKKIAGRGLAIGACAALSLSAVSCKTGDYKHGKKGYYSQVDNGIQTEVRDQGGKGNCWAHATDDSLRTYYQIHFGKDVPFTVDDVVSATYGPDKEEGLIVASPGQENNVGGSAEWAVWSLSNGYNGYVLTEAMVFYDAIDGEQEHEAYIKPRVSRQQIQEVIKNVGAVTCLVDASAGQCSSHGYMTIYDNEFADQGEDVLFPAGYFGHEAVIVGWDDHFPKEYFGKEYGKEPPKADGAWLMKDSDGTNAGNDGYFWVSYESAILPTMVLGISDQYSEVLSYEGGCPVGVRTGEVTTVANVFHHEGTLSAVGTYVGMDADIFCSFPFGTMDDTHIQIEIRDASMEKVLATKEVSFDYEGYYVVELDEPIEVSDFSVVISYNATAPIEAVDPDDLEEEGHGGHRVNYISGIEPGQSFIYLSGQWMDLADEKTQQALGLLYPTNNCCIKALFAK